MSKKDILLNIFHNKFFRGVFVLMALLLILIPVITYQKITEAFKNEVMFNINDDAKRVAKHIHTRHFDHKSISSLNVSMNKIVEDFNVYKIKLFDSNGIVIGSTQGNEVGNKNKYDYFYNKVVKGHIYYELVQKGTKSLEGKKVARDVVEIYIPIMEDGKFWGAFELYYDVTEKIQSFNVMKNDLKNTELMITTVTFFIFLFVLYYASKNDLKRELIDKELIKEKEKAEKANKSKSEFLANISHELRTPLNSIIGFNEILLNIENDEDKLKKLKIVNGSSKTLLQLINDILDFSKIETGKIEIETIDFDLHEELEDICKIFNFHIEEKNIDFVLNIDKNVPKIIASDPLRIKQIVMNLLSNAIKFTPKDKSIIMNVMFNSDNSRLRIEVIDQGIGISKDKQKLVFEKFSQADNSTTRKFGGTGLGLAISKTLSKLLGGDITLESKEEVGSKFTLEIVAKAKKTSKETASLNETISMDLSDKKVLLVEDNEINQILFSEITKEYGLNISFANDGIEALEVCQKDKFDMIFMDDKMPNMDGVTTIYELKKLNVNSSPIIAFTANAMTDDKKRFEDAGAVEFLSKPIEIDKLNNMLKKYLI